MSLDTLAERLVFDSKVGHIRTAVAPERLFFVGRLAPDARAVLDGFIAPGIMDGCIVDEIGAEYITPEGFEWTPSEPCKEFSVSLEGDGRLQCWDVTGLSEDVVNAIAKAMQAKLGTVH